MKLAEFQRAFKDAVLGRRAAHRVELGLRTRAATRAAVEYHRHSHWHKAVGSFALVFVSLRRELGAARFERVVRDYLDVHPLRGSNPYQHYRGLIAHLETTRTSRFLIELCRLEWEKLIALQVPEVDGDGDKRLVRVAPKVWLTRSRWPLGRYYESGVKPAPWAEPRWQWVRWEAGRLRFHVLTPRTVTVARRFQTGITPTALQRWARGARWPRVELEALLAEWIAAELVLAPAPRT